jgi:hypothetical protein
LAGAATQREYQGLNASAHQYLSVQQLLMWAPTYAKRVIAIDTNLLVFAHQADAPDYQAAIAALTPVFDGLTAWALSWHRAATDVDCGGK